MAQTLIKFKNEYLGLLVALCVCAILFAFVSVGDTYCASTYALDNVSTGAMIDSVSNGIGDSVNDEDYRIQFRTVNDRTIIFPYDTNTMSFHISYDQMYSQLGYKNGDVSYGTTESSNSNRWALFYPFSGNYVFPAAEGPLAYYGMDFKFRVQQCMSARDFTRAFPNREDIYRYQPYSIVDTVVLSYVTVNGEYREIDTNSGVFEIVFYNLENETDNISVTPTSIHYWNQLHSYDDITCHLRLRILELPSDFKYFVSTYIFFGRSFYFLYANDVPGNTLYFEVEPMLCSVSTFWYTDNYVERYEQSQDIFEDWFTPPVYELPDYTPDDSYVDRMDVYIDLEQSVDDKIEGMYTQYGVDPDSFGSRLNALISGVQGVTTPSFFIAIWNTCNNYTAIYWFINMALTFAVLIFILRR